jgi:large subunit ribosomal protein L20
MRIKRGVNKKQKHKKVLQLTKGFRLSYSKLYKRAKEALLHSGQYSFEGRKKRAGDFRRLWIKRINAALSDYGIKYSTMINKLASNKIELNRKVLADLALNNPKVFEFVVKQIQ